MLYLLINITVRCYLPDPRVATDQLRTRALRRHLPERMCRMHTHNAGHFTFCGRLPRPVAGIALEDDTAPPLVLWVKPLGEVAEPPVSRQRFRRYRQSFTSAGLAIEAAQRASSSALELRGAVL